MSSQKSKKNWGIRRFQKISENVNCLLKEGGFRYLWKIFKNSCRLLKQRFKNVHKDKVYFNYSAHTEPGADFYLFQIFVLKFAHCENFWFTRNSLPHLPDGRLLSDQAQTGLKFKNYRIWLIQLERNK